MTALTPIYGFPYLEVGQPVRDTRQVLEDATFAWEEALAARGIPPTDLPDLIAAGWFTDTGWQTVTLRAGYVGHEDPAVRRVGKIVMMRGGVTNATMTANTTHTWGDLPAGFAPDYTVRGVPGLFDPDLPGRGVVQPPGSLVVNVGDTVSDFYSFSAFQWLVP